MRWGGVRDRAFNRFSVEISGLIVSTCKIQKSIQVDLFNLHPTPGGS